MEMSVRKKRTTNDYSEKRNYTSLPYNLYVLQNTAIFSKGWVQILFFFFFFQTLFFKSRTSPYLFFAFFAFCSKAEKLFCVLATLEKLLLLALYQDFTYVSTILKQDNRRVATRFQYRTALLFLFFERTTILMIDFIGSIKCRLKKTSELEIKLQFFRNNLLLPSS